MNTLLCIYTVLKLFSLPSVTMTLQSGILNRYRFIWAFWLTFQIYSLNAKFSFSSDSNTTLLSHGFLLLAFIIFHVPWCKWERAGKNDERFIGICYCQKKNHIYFIATGPSTLRSSEIIGDVRLYVAQRNAMSKQPALRINHTGQA